MCEVSERAHQRRRHKAVYLAPSAGNLQHSQDVSSVEELRIPLLVEVSRTSTEVVSPPSSVGSAHSLASWSPPPLPPQRPASRSFRRRFYKAASAVYYLMMDFLLLAFVCLMGLFFDVEVQVVKSDRRRARARGRSGRVIIQRVNSSAGGTYCRPFSEVRTTNLLRPPSRAREEAVRRQQSQDSVEDGMV